MKDYSSNFRRWFGRRLASAAGGVAVATMLATTGHAQMKKAIPVVDAKSDVASPTVTGPIAATATPGDPSHNYPLFASNHDLPQENYIEEEFFIDGTATRYATPPLANGTPIDSVAHPYKTRILVRRPADKKQFNGTVLVEWYNVTNNFDADNFWFFTWEHIMRQGYIWVGVSAQRVGVNTGTHSLVSWSPRYSTLDVTDGGTVNDDSLCYDIFSQVARVLRNNDHANGGVSVLGGLKPTTFLAVGESQSAQRLSLYANSIQPLANIYDGLILLSSLGTKIRTDLSVPVWKVSTEYDVAQTEARNRQPDTNLLRLWEVTGSSHVDQHLRSSREPLELRDFKTSSEAALNCTIPDIGTRTPTRYVLASVIEDTVAWVTNGTQPPHAPTIDVASFNTAPAYSDLVRNSLGIAQGGIRLPDVDVPNGVNNGVNSYNPSDTASSACVRWGYYLPFDVSTLNILYGKHKEYVKAVTKSVKLAVKAGYILDIDGQQIVEDAADSHIGGPDNNGQFDSSLDGLN